MSEPVPASSYSATDLFAGYGAGWAIHWETFLDGPSLVAEERFAENPAKFTRKTPQEMRDCLADWETGRRGRAPVT